MGMKKSVIIISFAFGICLLGSYAYAKNSPQVKEYLSAHNKARGEIGVPELVWNKTLAADAEAYLRSELVGHCVLHVDLSSTGINVEVGDFSLTPSAAIKHWLHCATNSCCAAYTQVLSTTSSTLGCSSARCLNNEWMTAVVCKYHPPAPPPQ